MTETNKEKFKKAISYINRSGINELVCYLENETDFFTAPASSKYHGNYIGGLLDHTINVLEFALINFNQILKHKPELAIYKESVIISALFHDICKVNYYELEKKWYKDENDKWQSYMGYKTNDKFPLSHGHKSVIMVNKYMQLTEEEMLMIAYHMGNFDLNQPNSPSASSMGIALNNPLVRLLISADSLATTIENTIDPTKS